MMPLQCVFIVTFRQISHYSGVSTVEFEQVNSEQALNCDDSNKIKSEVSNEFQKSVTGEYLVLHFMENWKCETISILIFTRFQF